MNKLQINLSSRPFTNHTLYHVGFVVIGLLGLLLLAHNAWWFFSNHGDVRLMEQEISALQDEVELNIRETGSLAEEIDRIQRNRRFREVVAFVDGRIRQRQVSWIRMLNLLQDAIPPEVKIDSITPRVQQDSIRITLACVSKKQAAVNEFIENLEGIDEFDRVLITSEELDGNTVLFPLTMEYTPFGLQDAEAAGTEETTVDTGGEEAPPPGSLEEAISRVDLPDPDFAEMGGGDAEVPFDPFAVVEGDAFSDGGDMFSGEDDLFNELQDFEAEMGLPPPTSVQEPEETPGKGGGKKRSSGSMIKLPEPTPGSTQRPGSRRSGGGLS